MLLLPAAAILLGWLTALVFRWTTRPAALRSTGKRIYGHLLEFRLFFDEPALVWRAQLALLREQARFLGLLLPGILLLSLPSAWVMWQLDAFYGHRPLNTGEAAVVTAQLSRAVGSGDRMELRGEGAVRVETPPVRIGQDRQVSWRIRASGSGKEGALDLQWNGRAFRKTVWVTTRLTPPLQALGMPKGDVESLEVDYPKTSAQWILWFALLSSATAALCLRWTVTGRRIMT